MRFATAAAPGKWPVGKAKRRAQSETYVRIFQNKPEKFSIL